MAFSFNPNQNTTEGAVQQTPSSFSSTPEPQAASSATSLNDAPKAPDSPLLFTKREEGQEVSVNAYLQMLFMLISIVAIISAGTLFVYGWYLESKIESTKNDIASREASFKDYPFEEMRNLVTRAQALDMLLKNYVSVRSPLKFLEDVVEEKVYFDSFNFGKEKKSGYVANFTAVTNDYQSLIQQLEALRLTEYKKVATDPKLGKLTDEKNKGLRVQVTTPVFVQGKTSDEVVFVSSGTKETTSQESSNTQTP
jgi:hypothetical protein